MTVADATADNDVADNGLGEQDPERRPRPDGDRQGMQTTLQEQAAGLS
jgi:hypothetical protein